MTSAENTAGLLSILPTDTLTGSSADGLYGIIAAQYDVHTTPVQVGAEIFTLLRVRDTNRLLDGLSPELFSVDERLPYWADLWTSSIDLAGWMLADPTRVSGKNVLELGSGIGLAGIAAARAGAHVTLTDYETDALLFARYNALKNLPAGISRRLVHCTPLDWRTPHLNMKFDLVIGADIVYERRNFLPVLTLLQQHLVPGGQALFTEPDRTMGKLFVAAAREHSFSVEQSYSTVEREGGRFRISRMALAFKTL